MQGVVHAQRVARGGALGQGGCVRVGHATESGQAGASGDHAGCPYGVSLGAEYVMCGGFWIPAFAGMWVGGGAVLEGRSLGFPTGSLLS